MSFQKYRPIIEGQNLRTLIRNEGICKNSSVEAQRVAQLCCSDIKENENLEDFLS